MIVYYSMYSMLLTQTFHLLYSLIRFIALDILSVDRALLGKSRVMA